MADRTVKVRLVADISDFVTDIGIKAVAAVNKLERAAGNADKRIGKVGANTQIEQIGTKADAAGVKLEKVGVKGEASGKKIGAAAVAAGKDLDKLAAAVGKVDRATAASSKTAQVATKNADAQASAIGRLRVAQLRLAEVQANPKASAASTAGAEESVKAAERAVKKFEKAGDDSGRSFGRRFGAGIKKWFAGDGNSVFKQLGQNVGGGFFSSFFGILKTPVIGPAVLVGLIAALTAAAVPAGAVIAGSLVTGAGVGLSAIGLKFAAESTVVKAIWAKTASDLGEQTRTISKPFEATFAALSVVARRTFAGLKPELAAAFQTLAPALTNFGNQLGRALEKLGPALQPLSAAFSKVLAELGPAMNAVFSQLSASLIKLSESISKNPTAIADFARGLGGLTSDLLRLVTGLNDADASFKRLTGISAVTALMYTLRGAVAAVTGPISALAAGLSKIADGTRWAIDRQFPGQVQAAAASTTTFSSSLFKAASGLTASTNAALHNAHATHEANVAATLLAGAYDRQAAATQKAIDALNRESNLLLALSGSEIGYQQAVDDATASIKENGRTHDINTQKGRDNKRALDQVAASAIAQRDAMLKGGEGTVKAAAAAETGHAAFIRLAHQMGYSIPVAKAMADSLIKIPNVTRTAKLNANIADLESKLATAKTKLKDKTLTATQRAKLEANIKNLEAGIAAAKAALASVPTSKTVTITANTYRNLIETTTHRDVGVRVPQADGGYWPKGIPSYANGKLPGQATIAPGKGRGMVQWAEQETGGEAFIPLAPSKRDRSEKILGQVADKFGMGLVRSFADGGFTLPGGRLTDIALILKQLGLPFDPVAGVNYNSTLTAANRANRAIVPARDSAVKADRAEQAAKAEVARIQRLITLQQRAITAARAGKPTTKAGQAAEDRRVAAEQKKLIGLQDQLYVAKKRTTAATVASNKADAVYKIRAEQAAKAAEVNKAALEKLVEQQKAAVDLANQVATGLTGDANIGDLFGKSLTGKGLLADLQGKGADLKQFGLLIAQLRAQKLDEGLITQIIGKGSAQGGDLAQAILNGGLGLVASLNKAQKNLDDQANLIGAGEANAQYGVKVAGARAGGGGVTAGMTYRVNEKGEEFFTAPINGHVIPADVDPNRYIRTAFGGGSSQTTQVVREVHHHQTNQFHGVSMAEADLIAQRANAKADLMNRGY